MPRLFEASATLERPLDAAELDRLERLYKAELRRVGIDSAVRMHELRAAIATIERRRRVLQRREIRAGEASAG